MSEQEQQAGGRRIERQYPVKRITLEMSLADWEYITLKNLNRTQWINDAIREKRERERAQERQ